MEDEDMDAGADISHRIAHACQLCREKRIRCSGHRPKCERCEQVQVDCLYGYARGARRRSLLAALDQHNARTSESTSDGQAVSRSEHPLADGSTKMRLIIVTNGSSPTDDEVLTSDDSDEATESSIQSPTLLKPKEATPDSHITTKGARHKQQRRTRISSACLECKKRRRRCTGEIPCQTCTTFQTECLYDRTQDRRSKAYFQKKLNDRVREALQSENTGGVLKLLRQNDHYDEVASELQTALKLAEDSKTDITSSDSSPQAPPNQRRRIICKEFCGVGLSSVPNVQWISSETQSRQERLLGGPHHLILPYIVPTDSPLSLAFSNFRDAVTHMLSEGVTLPEILGPWDIEVDLLFRSRRSDDPFTAGTWACEIARIFTHISVYTKLAMTFLLSRFMRWVLDPSMENYIMLPDIIKPTDTQRTIPHYAFADFFPLPSIRNSLIHGELNLAQAIGPEAVQGVKFGWQFGLEKAICRDPLTGTATISRLFAACAPEAKYWSCGRDFLESFPELRGALKVITHQHEWN